MQMHHSFEVPAPIDKAWELLNDVARMAPCLPGATLDTVDGDDFTGRVKVKIGAITMSYAGKGTFIERDEAERRMAFEASGRETRGAGSVAVTVSVSLSGDETNTIATVTSELALTGKPAQFGRGILDDIADKIIGQFAKNLAADIEASQKPAPVAISADSNTVGDSATSAVPPVRENEALDLLEVAGLKAFLPKIVGGVGALLATLFVVHRVLRRR